MILFVSVINLEVSEVWFPINENIRHLIMVYGLRSDKKLSGKVSLSISIKSPGKAEFSDEVKQNLPKSNYSIIFYEGAVGWDSVEVFTKIKGKGINLESKSSILNFGKVKTSSLILAYNISENDSSAIFKRGELFVRPCFNCVFWGEMFYYLEVLTDSQFTVIGAVFSEDKPILRLSPRTFNSSSVVYSKIPIWDLKDGKYRLIVEVISPKENEKVTLEKEFFVSMYGDDIASFIDYIASPKEKSEFERITSLEGKLKFLKEFWERRGSEYYMEFRERVRYADSAFSTKTLRGRYTDMGRIYIKRGKPDEISRVDIGIQDKPYIRWFYYSGGGYDYIFGDPVGTGEYILIKTNDPEEARFVRPTNVPSLDINREIHWGW
jgi:GWxTD domain-containing protein